MEIFKIPDHGDSDFECAEGHYSKHVKPIIHTEHEVSVPIIYIHVWIEQESLSKAHEHSMYRDGSKHTVSKSSTI